MAPLEGGSDDSWDDDDEKTTVFDRSHEESAQALLQKSPTPAAGAAAGMSAPPPPPSIIPSRPAFSGAGSASAAAAQASAQQHVRAPVTSAHVASARPPGAAGFLPGAALSESIAPNAIPGASKNRMMRIAAAAVAVVVLAFLFFGGNTGAFVISVAGPGGTAVDGVSVVIDGEEVCNESSCKVEELEAGSYVIKARAAGYTEMAGKAYTLEAGEQMAINIELVTSSGGTGLKISSNAPGLTLIIDSKKLGVLPQEITDIKPGEHRLELTGSPFIDAYEKTITITKGETLEFEPELKLSKGQADIKLDSSAQGARVALLVNGKRRSLGSRFGKSGSKSVKIDLPLDGKSYKIRATKKGFKDYERELSFTLEKPVHSITISMSKEEEEEEATASSSRSRSSGRRPSTRSKAPKPAASSGKGTLNINSLPKSTIILDGRPLGSTPKIGVSVSAGSHMVVFVHPKHGRKAKRVTVTKGGIATAAVRFP